jgi:hypothetical protein
MWPAALATAVRRGGDASVRFAWTRSASGGGKVIRSAAALAFYARPVRFAAGKFIAEEVETQRSRSSKAP